MNYFKKSSKHTLYILILLILSACGDTTEEQSSTFELDEKIFLFTLFSTEYLWSDTVIDTLDYASLSSPQNMINALKYSALDKWSFSLSLDDYDDIIENSRASGFGFSHTQDFLVTFVRIDSPSDKAGLKRGDKITLLNGSKITDTLLNNSKNNLNSSAHFTVLRNGEYVELQILPSRYSYKLSSSKVIQHGPHNVGYLRLDSFSTASVEELQGHFSTFKQSNIDELVIDLRYNGGGAVSMVSILLDHISNAYPGKRQMYDEWNENFRHKNGSYSFEQRDEQDGDELTMKRVFFLVTKGTASASESVINALVPYLGKKNVITIGSNTHGKPVGMSPRVYGSNIYYLVNFVLKNNAGQSTAYSGIPSTCPTADDLTKEMGDSQENMFRTALHYIGTGRCN